MQTNQQQSGPGCSGSARAGNAPGVTQELPPPGAQAALSRPAGTGATEEEPAQVSCGVDFGGGMSASG